MVKAEKLKQMLQDAGYKCVRADGDTEDLWEDPAGHTMVWHEAVAVGLKRCVCCGETYASSEPSAACATRHEGKDCNCFPKQTQVAGCDNTAGNSDSRKDG